MRKCWLCGRNGFDDPLDRHHVFNGAFKKKSEHYGAVIDLCHNRCHIFGINSVHRNPALMREIKAHFQAEIMAEHNMTTEEFIRIFGKNYI